MVQQYAIKFREKSKKRFKFLTSKGGGNYLQIHAARFEREKVDALMVDILGDPDNVAQFDFQVVEIGRP